MMKHRFLLALVAVVGLVLAAALVVQPEAAAQNPFPVINGLAVIDPDPQCGRTFTVHVNVTNQGNALSVAGVVTLQNVHRGTGSVNWSGQADYPSIEPGGNYVVVFQVKPNQYISEGQELRASTYGQTFTTKYDIDQGSCSKTSSSDSSGGGSYYIIQARHSGKCLDVRSGDTSDGAPVQQYSCHGGDNQQWALQSTGNGFYQLVGRRSGKCLDVKGGSRDDRTPLQIYSCHSGDNQEYRLQQADGPYFLIVNKQSGKCVDVRGADTGDQTPVQQYTCTGSSNQQWQLR